MLLAVPAETRASERRVAMVPDVARRLVEAGWSVAVQAGAGERAAFDDSSYVAAGAQIVPDPEALLDGADVVLAVNPPDKGTLVTLVDGASVVSFLQAAAQPELMAALSAKKAHVFSFDLVPRISRAQSMDALSSQATVAGYRAGLLAAGHLTKFFPMFMTDAGTVPQAKGLLLGVGVAGLQA
ncbi:MAG: NAD(P)(+) transhydrogenase (Re/Si-specific) subunit alpha, partial [Acidimicrobiales bacterium]